MYADSGFEICQTSAGCCVKYHISQLIKIILLPDWRYTLQKKLLSNSYNFIRKFCQNISKLSQTDAGAQSHTLVLTSRRQPLFLFCWFHRILLKHEQSVKHILRHASRHQTDYAQARHFWRY